MCGIWRTRSAYGSVFRIQSAPSAARSLVALPPPPPISPVTSSFTRYDSDIDFTRDSDLSDAVDDVEQFTGVMVSKDKAFMSIVYEKRTQVVAGLSSSTHNRKLHASGIHGKRGLANIVAILEPCKRAIVLDLTNSPIVGITTKMLLPGISVTMHAIESVQTNEKLMSIINTSGCQVLKTPILDFSPEDLIHYTHIITDFIKLDINLIKCVLMQFAESVTTSIIVACITRSRRNILANLFVNLEFVYLPVMFSKNSEFLSGYTRTYLVRIRHRMSNNQSGTKRPRKIQSLPRVQTAPTVLQHAPEPEPLRESSPLTVDFTYDIINPTFFQEQLEFLTNESSESDVNASILPIAQLDNIAPFTETIPEDIPLNPTPIVEVEDAPTSPLSEPETAQDVQFTSDDEEEEQEEGDFYPETPDNSEITDTVTPLCESHHVESLDVLATHIEEEPSSALHESLRVDELNVFDNDVEEITSPSNEPPQSESFDVEEIPSPPRRMHSPVIACQDDYDDDDAIEILSDDDNVIVVLSDSEENAIQGIDLDVHAIQGNLRKRRSAFKTFRETLPVCSSSEYGGSCPTASNAYVSAMADIICDYVRTHDGPYNFLDVRSRSIIAAHLSTAFPQAVSFGHVAYSKEYLFDIKQTHNTIRAAISVVASSLNEINPNTFNGYQMIYVMAPWMDKDNSELNRIILSFINNTDTRVLWLQLKAEQYKNLRARYSTIEFSLKRAKMPGTEGSLYEIRK